jgi:hypothetical protein
MFEADRPSAWPVQAEAAVRSRPRGHREEAVSPSPLNAPNPVLLEALISNPAKLQVFLPRSIPSTAMGVLIIGPLLLSPTAYRQDVRGGPSHKAFLDRLAQIAQAVGGKLVEV